MDFNDDVVSYFNMRYMNQIPVPTDMNSLGDSLVMRFFNPSIVHLINNLYLVCFRIISSTTYNTNEHKKKETRKFKPGNNSKCLNIKKYDEGENYWWNHWGSLVNGEGALFLGDIYFHLYDYSNKTFLLLKPKDKFGKVIDVLNNTCGDFRLTKIDNKIYLHDSCLKYIAVVELIFSDGNNAIIIDEKIRSYKYKENTKNVQLLDFTSINGDHDFRYLDWFDRIGLKISDHKYNSVYIKYDKYKIDGNGSHIPGTLSKPKNMEENLDAYNKQLDKIKKEFDNIENDKAFFGTNYGIIPLFSFSTPVIRYENMIIGVGHTKIHSDDVRYKYATGSHINKFRHNLHNEMRTYFGNNYIRHFGTNYAPYCNGYIYMMYFYLLDDKMNTMKLSNSFLPIILDDTRQLMDKYDNYYKFSLIFPSGIARLGDDKIIITAGEGDYYPVELEFTINDVIKLCNHDIRNMDMKNYEYKIITKYDNKIYVDARLNSIINKINTGFNLGGSYAQRYVDNKKKYLKLHAL